MKRLKHAAFFNGIGGFQLAAKWMGWINVFSSEIDPFCNKITKHHFPNCIQYEDINTTDFTRYRDQIDIATGGFPCQPFSTAGRRNGTDDNRYLWPPFLRAIDQVRPTWAVLENVVGITSMVQSQVEKLKVEEQKNIFSSENDKIISEIREFVIETICKDLEQIGYTVAPVIIPASAIGAPHERKRIFFIAHTPGDRWRGKRESLPIKDGQTKPGSLGIMERGFKRFCLHGNAPDSVIGRLPIIPRGKLEILPGSQGTYPGSEFSGRNTASTGWGSFPTESPVCGGNDGLPDQLDGITFSEWRRDSLKAYGNAIVPHTAFEIFKAIEQSYNDQ